jgi:hypothetical protein
LSTSPPPDTQIKFLAGIGHVCLQWALLEHLLLGCIAAVEGMPLEKTYIMFGGTDMVARCGIAINLARAANLPGTYPARLDAIRKELRAGLQERRNQAVHGVHAAADVPDAMKLTIAKWTEPKRHQVISLMDLFELGKRLSELGGEANAIQDAIWEHRIQTLENRLEDHKDEIAKRHTSVWLKLREYLNASINRIMKCK